MTDKDRAQTYLQMATKATEGPWRVQEGDDETADEIFVWDQPSRIDEYPSYTTIAEELLARDSRFIVASRTEGPYFAKKYLAALEEIEKLHKGLSYIRHIIDDPHYTISAIQKRIDRLMNGGDSHAES